MRWVRLLGWTAGGMVAVLALAFAAIQTAPGKRVLADLISSLASSDDSRLEIAGISGVVPTSFGIEKVTLADRDGIWLAVDGAQLHWSFMSLFTGRLKVGEISARRVDLRRAPMPSQAASASTTSGGGVNLPVGIELGRLAVEDLHVGAALAGVDSRWKLDGDGVLAVDRSQSRIKLGMSRTDGPKAEVAVDLGFGLAPFDVDGRLSIEESTRGGVIAALIGRPDLEHVSATLKAKGDRGAGAAQLNVAAGDAVRSTGAAHWHPDGSSTAVSLDVSLVAPGLPDSPVARLLRQPATLKGEATLDPSDMLDVRSLALAVGPARIDATARYDTRRDTLQATAKLQTGPAGPFADLAGGVDWSGLRADVTADATGVTAHAQGSATLTASMDGLAVKVLGDRAPPPQHVDLSAKLGLQADSQLLVEQFEVSSPLVSLKGNAGYRSSTDVADGTLAVDLPDLSLLSGVAGLPLGGHGRLDLTVSHRRGGERVEWRGSIADLSLPDLPAALQRQTLRLRGGAALQKDGAWRLDAVRIENDALALGLSGQGREQTGNLALTLEAPKLGILRQDLTGAVSARGTLALKPSGGDLHLSVDLADLGYGTLMAHRLALALDAALDGGTARGSVKAEGDLANRPLTLAGSFSRSAAGGIHVPSVQGSWASASADVSNLEITPGGAVGSGRLKMTRLEDLAPLIGIDLAGALDVGIATTSDARAGKVIVTLRGDRLRTGTTGVGTLQVDATVSDPLGRAGTDTAIKASGLSGVADIAQVNATVKGDRGGYDVALQVSGAATGVNLAAKVEPAAEAIRIGLQRLDARYRAIPIALNAPTQVTVAGTRVTIRPASLRVGGGRVAIGGTIGDTTSNLDVEIAALPLSLLDAFAPGTDLEGTLQAKLHLSGEPANPRIEATYSGTGLRLKQPEMALVPSLALRGSASMVDRRATFDATVTAGSATRLAFKGNASLPQGNAPLTATVGITGAVDLVPFGPVLGNSLRNVAGTLSPNLSLTTDGASITGSGTMTLAGGALALPASGLRLSNGRATFVLQGDTLTMQGLSFQTARNGTFSGSGTVRLDPAQGFPTDLAISSQQALVANRPDLAAAVSSNLKIAGSTLNGFEISGPVKIDSADIGIGGAGGGSFPTVEVREINSASPAAIAAALAPTPPGTGQPRPAPSPGVRLALDISAPGAVFVRGRGLNAEVGGQFTVTGDPSAPTVLGSLSLRRGTFNLLGRRLTFIRGNVWLENANTIDPALDFAATTTVQSTTIEVDITGTPRAPKISLTSSPSLPQDEAMAMLLFGRSSSTLSPFELVTAAQALGELTGGSPLGGGFFARLRRSLGLDQLSVNTTSTTNATTGATSSSASLQGGRYIAPGVYVGAQQGASDNSSRGVVEIEVLPHTKVEGAFGTDSNDRVGAKMEWDY
ncbi:MAG: translocation/assembly module TamB domain-containing protein [Proteobacteria bacterium]|nr:translocation/assembly module TamB domain-containing protein [Pseudomonadota bacterium]